MYVRDITQQFYDYSIYIKGYSKFTIRRYKTCIQYLISWAKIESIEEINADIIRSFFLYGRSERQWKSNTYISFYHSLLVFFRWCVREKYLTTNPIEELEVPKLEKRIPPKLTKEESLRLLEVVYNYPYSYPFLRYRNHAIFALFLFAGLRKSELINLRFTDIDIDNKSIFVHQGKGNKDRIIPMSFTLAQSLRRYVEERKRYNKTCPEFFATPNRNTGLSYQCLKRLVVQIREISHIPFTCHKLRHSFATLMLEGGCDIYSLSKMMGHADIKTTTIYLAASVEHLRGQMGKHPLNNIL